MRVLENRLDKLMIKNNEALNIKQTYTVLLQKFREEKVSYDNQLQQLEKSLIGKTATLQDLMLMSAEAKKAQS